MCGKSLGAVRLDKSVKNSLVIYTGPNCHLCEQAKALLYPLLSERGLRLVEVNIQADAEVYKKSMVFVFRLLLSLMARKRAGRLRRRRLGGCWMGLVKSGLI